MLHRSLVPTSIVCCGLLNRRRYCISIGETSSLRMLHISYRECCISSGETSVIWMLHFSLYECCISSGETSVLWPLHVSPRECCASTLETSVLWLFHISVCECIITSVETSVISMFHGSLRECCNSAGETICSMIVSHITAWMLHYFWWNTGPLLNRAPFYCCNIISLRMLQFSASNVASFRLMLRARTSSSKKRVYNESL